MAKTINFGIDLGTTNSLIAKYISGKVEVFKNPVGHKETLPSVVAFRNNRIIIGDKAKEYIEKDAANVFSSFKRKMGTNEFFTIKSTDSSITPMQLSSLILKELKNFVYTGEEVESVVITIPASFDTIQSNATKKAGLEAGFKDVVLLQEPIAASLAYANYSEDADKLKGQWLVYDLGGGTFDVALVKIEDEEMKIVDHEGDNFLGGVDFDKLIIEKIIFPKIHLTGTFSDLENQMKSSTGKHHKLYQVLLHKAEEVKILLSHNDSADIEFEITDDAGLEHDVFFAINKIDFEQLIKPIIESTIVMIQGMLAKNAVDVSDVNYVLMVGGSTYIPLVRQMINEKLGVKVDCSIDPTTTVVIGSAFYAGTKTAGQYEVDSKNVKNKMLLEDVVVRMGYQKTSQSNEEYFVAEIDSSTSVSFYRITRDDGGFDSGLKKFSDRITEMLPLLPNTFNNFTLKLLNSNQLLVNASIPKISILHGKYSVVGQPLPHDICIEVDDFGNNTTKLEVVFEKNAILPIKKTITRTVSKNIMKDSEDSLIINVLEGDRYASPASNQPIGIIEVKGADLPRDLVKGSDVEITLEISESRDLKIETYLLMTDQEFSNIFNPSQRHVNITKLKDDTVELLHKAKSALRNLEKLEKYEEASVLNKLLSKLENLRNDLNNLSVDDATDARYQLEDLKRKLSKEFDKTNVGSKVTAIKAEYFQAKGYTKLIIDSRGNEFQKEELRQIVQPEKEILATNNYRAIKNLIDRLNNLQWQLNQKDPNYLIRVFYYYSDIRNRPYKNLKKAKNFVEKGEKALERKNYDELLVVIHSLHELLPEEEKHDEQIKGTGLM